MRVYKNLINPRSFEDMMEYHCAAEVSSDNQFPLGNYAIIYYAFSKKLHPDSKPCLIIKIFRLIIGVGWLKVSIKIADGQ